MKNKILLFSIFLFASQFLAAQYYTGSFRSEKNPHYWKNKKPHAAYWQQDVEYKIKAAVDEKTRRIIANQSLNYYNNSPDTLTFIYFHLYQNAFTKGSYLDKLHSDSKEPITKYGKYEENGMGTIVDNISINGKKVKSTLDNTILKIYLNENILPNTSVNIEMDFTTFFDYSGFRRRMQLFNANGFPHFNGVHWYPRICVYDAKKGWDTDQHLNKELYGNYGSFEVELNFANNYIVEATGVLMNEKEMIPEELKQKIDLKNYVKSSKEEKEKNVIPYDSTKRKTWFFYSVNTHDFAFTAHPDYLRDEVVWNGIRCIALVKKQNANGWKNGAEYVSKIIKTFSTDFGMYEYPKMVAADANDGMEYPMITLDSGNDPGYRGLLVHEIGHNWFYGMIGNNETYRAALDEGFTQFITAWGLKKIDGENIIDNPSKNKYYNRHKKPVNVRDRSVFYRYVSDAMMNEDLPLNTHSNDFHSAIGHGGGYSNVYYKTATMLYNLQYVLGDEQFLKAMNYYVAQWKFCHPYFEDFRRSIIEYTKQDLNWFFDEWLETNKTIDYKIQSVKNTKLEGKQRITLKRKGEMQMPLDLKVVAKNGEAFYYHIPNQTYIKPYEGIVLPKWYGWDVLNKTYSFDVKIPSGIKSVEIDPSHRLADINKTNNAKTKGSLFSPITHELKRENFINQFPEWKKYQATWTPNIWYNAVDGIKLGVQLKGSYNNFLNKLDARAWLNTHILQQKQFAGKDYFDSYKNYNIVHYDVNFETPFTKISKQTKVGFGVRNLDGFLKQQLFASQKINDRNNLKKKIKKTNVVFVFINLYVFLKKILFSTQKKNDRNNLKMELVSQSRNFNGRDYLFDANEWTSERNNRNTYLQMQWRHNYQYEKGNGMYQFTARLPIEMDYKFIQLEAINNNVLLKKMPLKTRFFARLGAGKNIPTESALYLAGANPEEQMEDKFYRSYGVLPQEIGSFSAYELNHLQKGGGLNLRGYAGYYAFEENNNTIYTNYKSRSGVAVNAELELDNLIKWQPKLFKNWLHLDVYLFGDVGIVERSAFNYPNFSILNPASSWSKVRADAGLGTFWTIKKFGVLNKLKPFTVRLDMPFFLNTIPGDYKNFVDYRWVVGIGRAF